MRGILRDHYDAGPVHRRREFEDPQFFSLCMHADPLDNTTAAMVARLPADPSAVGTAWVCPGSPCVGAFLPCYVEGTVPERLARGDAEAHRESPWWRMRELLTLVESETKPLEMLLPDDEAFRAMVAKIEEEWGEV